MKFCTVINCLDGRIQLPIISYLQKRFHTEYVDSITEAGPNLILSELKSKDLVQSILKKVKISIDHHNSVGIAIVGHHDCVGNPTSKDHQMVHLKKAMQYLQKQYGYAEIIGLWIDENMDIHEVNYESKRKLF